MTKNRIWDIGAILAMVAIVAAGWFLGIQPQLATAATADRSRVAAQLQNASNETMLASLKRDFSKIGALKIQLASLQDSVPENTGISALVTEFDSLAGARQVAVTAIRVADATVYSPPVAAVLTPAAGSTAGPNSTATPTPAPVAPTAPIGALQVTNPKITAVNFVAIPVQLTITGQYPNVLDFVNGLQTGQRLFLVTSLSIKTAKGNAASPGFESSIGGLVYVLLQKGATAAPAG